MAERKANPWADLFRADVRFDEPEVFVDVADHVDKDVGRALVASLLARLDALARQLTQRREAVRQRANVVHTVLNLNRILFDARAAGGHLHGAEGHASQRARR